MNRSIRRTKDRSSMQPPLTPNRRRSRAKPAEKEQTKIKKSGRAKKIFGAALRLFATLTISGATVWAGLAAYRHATSSDYFAVTDFQIEGLRRLEEPEILTTAAVPKGTNVFSVDTTKVETLLKAHPWIADAAAHRRLPRSVEIEITERIAVATVLFDVPYLVDDTGEVFKRWARGDPTPAPVLTGFSREQFVSDSSAVRETIRDAIDLAQRYRASGLMKKAPLAEIHCEVDGDFSLAISGDPVYVRFGRGPYRTKLKRLATLLRRLHRDGERPAMIYFDNEVRPDRVTVQLKKDAVSAKDTSKKPSATDNLQKRMSKI